MSISIGRNRVYSQVDQPLLIYTESSNAILLKSDTSNVYIEMDQYRLGQSFSNNETSFKFQYRNTTLCDFTSNQTIFTTPMLFTNPTIFESPTIFKSAIEINQPIAPNSLRTSNIQIETYSGIPLHITSNQEVLLTIDSQERLFYKGNVGIGLSHPMYALEVSESLRVHSNIQSQQLATEMIYYKTIGNGTQIEMTDNRIHLKADTVQVNNPVFLGPIEFQDLSIVTGNIERTITSNVYIYNSELNHPGIYIQQQNSQIPPYFSDTLLGNPISIDSYFYNIDSNLRIFQVDTYGRISSGKITVLNEPDYGIQYYIESSRANYFKGFLNFETDRLFEQTVINSKGYLSIGSNLTKHPLQITQSYTGYESHYIPVSSLIGLYQQTSNETAFLKCFNCNQEAIFTLTSNGGIVFGNHKLYGNDYTLENSKKSYLKDLKVQTLFSDQSMNFQRSTLSNIQMIYTCNLDVQYAVLSNLQVYNLSINSIETTAFETIDDVITGYSELRVNTNRFLFIGSNMVLNPNKEFFQQQPALPDDNLRIYANGGSTRNVNVIHTIANNQTSGLRMNNCNVAINAITKVELEANQNRYNFGVINKSTTPGSLSEAFITNNDNLTNDNRQLNITSVGCRIGGTSGIHLLQTGRITINDTVDSTTNLRIKGNINLYTDTTPSLPVIITDKTTQNVGIGTTLTNARLHVQGTVYMSSNLEIDGSILTIGTGYPNYQYTGNNTLILSSSSGTINGVNITELNKRTHTSYASALACVSSWTSRNSTADNTWTSVCWSSELSLFVAVASTGTSNGVMTSPDGITWTARTPRADNAWTSVCFSTNSVQYPTFVAVASSGTGNRIMVSANGISWSYGVVSPPADNNWTSVCWSPELEIFVAVASSGSGNRVMTGDKIGANWTLQTSAADNDWVSVCWSSELSLFVAVASNGSNNCIMTSPDGVTWLLRTTPTMGSCTSICWSPELSLFVVVASSGTYRLMTSSDGIDWTLHNIGTIYAMYSVCWSPELSVFVATSTNVIRYSMNGTTWNTVGAGNTWSSICWSPELSIFVTVSNTGTGNRVRTSAIGMPNAKSVVKALPSQVYVNPLGNVGIGTTLPVGKFHLTGSLSNVVVDSRGYLGIGTLLPIHPFQLVSQGSSMVIDTNGNVGIGTTLPVGELHLTGSLSNVVVDSRGYMGIGTTMPSQPFQLITNGHSIVMNSGGTSAASLDIYRTDTNTNNYISIRGTSNREQGIQINDGVTDIYLYKPPNTTRFSIWNGGERLTISQNGNIGIGTTITTAKLYVAGQIYATENITAFSDSNYKTNIQRIPNALEKITNVHGYTFNKLNDPNGKSYMGVLAQEVEPVFPELIEKQGDTLSVAYGNMVAPLIEMIHELKERVEKLEKKMG